MRWLKSTVPAATALALGLLAILAGNGSAQKPEPVELFNGQNLQGWYSWIKGRGKGVDPKEVFSVKEG